MSFTHLHVHTSYSALESTVRIDYNDNPKKAVPNVFSKCLEYGMSALAMTDHGNLCGAIDFFNNAKKAGVKPIFGCDFYLKVSEGYENHRFPYSRLVLLAKNKAGFQNLVSLVSRSYLEGRSSNRPLIDKSWVQDSSSDLICLTGGLKGETGYHLLQGREDLAQKELEWLQSCFKDNLFLELQENNLAEQERLNEWLMAQGKAMNIRPVATSDVHYLEKEDAMSHEIFVLTQLGRTVSDENKRSLCTEFWFKDPETMKEQFAFCPEALENTNLIAEQCSVEFKFVDEKGRPIYHLPKFEIPKEESVKTAEDYLALESERGLEWRFNQPSFLPTKQSEDWKHLELKYRDRLQDEVKMIQATGFSGYFLIVSDFIKWAKKQGIPVGPGRGSGAGSLVAWALQIIDIDPIPYNLLFERFINPERISMPDFDVDFCMDKRGEVIDYVKDKYGRDQVSQIITFGRLQTKQCIRDVGRVLGMPYGEVDQIAKLVPEQLGISLREALEKEPRFNEMRDENPTVDKLFNHALKLEGLTRSFGKHAGGVIITDKPLTNYAPLMMDEDGAVVIQYDKDAGEKVGLVKFDFLGLKTLTHIQRAVDLINGFRKKEEPVFRIEDIGVYDAEAYALIAKGDTNGVFQVESSGMSELCKKLGPSNLEELTWINALYRPGPLESGMVDDFVERKHGRVTIEYPVPQLEEVLRESLGVIIYQEQVMRAARVLAGYSLGEADLLRRAMGKKKPEEMAKMKKGFVERAEKNGIPSDKATEIFDLIEKFAGYGFNKSHATAYAYVSFQTAYLKAHYPAEFYAALLTTEMSDTDRLAKYIGDAKDHQIQVLGPDINQSVGEFNVVEANGTKTIRFGLEAIKGCGAAAVDEIVQERKEKGVFRSFPEFCKRMVGKKVNKKTIEALIKAGAFDSVYADNSQVTRHGLFKAMEMIGAWAIKEAETESLGQANLFAASFADSDGPNLLSAEPAISFQQEWNQMERLESERELLGFYVSGHPLDPYTSLLRECASYTISRIFELSAEGKFEKKPDQAKDWKARKAQQANAPRIGGMISASKEIMTKKGDRMAFVTLEDLSGKIEVVCFPRAYEKCKDYLFVGNVVVVQGDIEGSDGGAKILAIQVEPLELASREKIQSVKSVVFRLNPEKTSKKQLEDLKALCVRNKGACKGVIEYVSDSGVRARFQFPDDLKFSADYGFIQEVKEIFGSDVLGFQ
ncbi:MAG: DNA polymerase III subunit alpha [Oligoflexia bacterium]|nr:DNA polymerase III subunit alpha [Oligoflexia bacterium]